MSDDAPDQTPSAPDGRTETKRPHHVIGALDLMVDVLDSGPVGWKQRDGVVNFVDPKQRRVADPVAHPRVADLGPEGLVAHRVRGAKADMAEAGDAGIALAMITAAANAGRQTSSIRLPVGSLNE